MRLHTFEQNSKHGYRDENGTIIIPAKYEYANEFKGNTAIVKYNGFYGVINISEKVVIDFAYSSVEEHNLFFECRTVQDHKKTLWYNQNGVLIHEGNADALSEMLLCISNGKKYGVIGQDGKRIINCLYDEIVQQNELIIVRRDDKVGLYDLNGNVILDTFCNSIESVVIENNPMLLGTTSFSKNSDTNRYLGYCKDFYFDTDNTSHTISPYIHFWCGTGLDLLYREAIIVTSKWKVYNVNEKYNPEFFVETVQNIKDITKPMIISTGIHKMLFLKSEGILPNSEFDDIQQLTSISYAVKKNNHWGVYRLDTRNCIIPIEYDSIRFYGGHTVLLRKDGFWGAKDILLTDPYYSTYKVSIPTEYLEIKILDDNQKYYGCKKNDNYNNEPCYILVRYDGEEIDLMEFHIFDSQFIYFDSSHFLTSQDGKYGFISVNGFTTSTLKKEGTTGYTSIPFKYDEVRMRDDGLFNVRIDNKWGILSIEGREITPIKYIEPLPDPFNVNVKVQDADSLYFGVLSPTGFEIIPTIYQHLLECKKEIVECEDNDIYFWGYGEWTECIHEFSHENTYIYDFFPDYPGDILWGVVDKTNKQIIDAKYACFKIQSKFLMAGRDGNCKTYPSDAIYDLYTKEGEFLIGGFHEFYYDETHELFFLFFGGEFECGGEHTVWGDFDEHESWDYYERFNRGTDLWLILDKNLETVIRDEEGKRFQFPKGFMGRVDVKKEGKKKEFVYNMPLQYFATLDHCNMRDIISKNSIIIKYGTQAIDIATGKMTKEFSHIEQVTDKLFLFKDENTVGLTNIGSEVLLGNCFFITRPVSNYFFLAKEKSENVCCVWLYDIENIANPISIAISEITKEKSFAERDCLKIKYNKNLSGLKSIVLQISDIFDAEFASKITFEEKRGTYSVFYHDTSYFVRCEIPSI